MTKQDELDSLRNQWLNICYDAAWAERIGKRTEWFSKQLEVIEIQIAELKANPES